MIFWGRKKAAQEAPRTAAEQYVINEEVTLGTITIIEDAIPKNLEGGKYALATSNYASLAEYHTELGLLHWRCGLDPRGDFANGMTAYDKASAIAREHRISKNEAEIPIVYAMLSLMGRKAPIEFEDAAYHKEHRWPCYECCLAHALQDQPRDSYHEQLLNTYLGVNDDLADQTVRTYFQLLESPNSADSIDGFVRDAEVNWIKRKHSKFFSDGGSAFNGFGIMNELYVDIFLAAVLHKIGWQGESIHRWKWS